MALNVNIVGRDSEGNLQALKVNSEGKLEISDKDFATESTLSIIKDNQGRLYGKYGEEWLPILVDSTGRLLLASDVTVNAEGLTVDLGQIKQGPAGTEPWPVQLSGTIVSEAGATNIVIAPGESKSFIFEFNNNVRYTVISYRTRVNFRKLDTAFGWYLENYLPTLGLIRAPKSEELFMHNEQGFISTLWDVLNYRIRFAVTNPVSTGVDVTVDLKVRAYGNAGAIVTII